MRLILLCLLPLTLLAQSPEAPNPAIAQFGVRNGASLAPGGLVSIDAEASFDSPALSHGTASYRAARTTLVPFE